MRHEVGVWSMADIDNKIMEIYDTLLDHYGPCHWWPGDTPFEVMLGAVLTQAVAWRNAERAIFNLKQADLMTVEALLNISREQLADLIRPALYHRQKARKVQELMAFISDTYEGSLNAMFEEDEEILRTALLGVWGIGPETADSILLYAGNYPTFVVDAYTVRIFSRLGAVSPNIKYPDMQLFMRKNVKKDVYFYNEYHALLVNLGKDFCLKTRPRCSSCPLKHFCGHDV